MSKQTAKTTERSLALIDTIQELGGATLEELTSELEIARSTIHVHLQTLVSHGYIEKEGEVYHIGLKFLNRGEYARTRKKAYGLAGDTVSELSSKIDEEVEFVVENNGRGILVHESFHPGSQFTSKENHATKSFTSAGIYYRLHCVATGKAILAEYSDERIDEIIGEWGLPPSTEQTITDAEQLVQELERIRERGIAFADEEYLEGLREVGKTVSNPDGSTVGAIAVIGPTYRFANERFTEEIPALLEEHVTRLEDEIEDTYLDNYR